MKNIDKKRDLLIQLMYSAEIQGYEEVDLVSNFWLSYPDTSNEEKLDIEDEFEKVCKDIESNDNVTKDFISSSWSIERISLIERIILRLGISELFSKQYKKEIILRDYVALAKRYGDNKSAAFINGMLDNIAKKFDL